MPSLGYATEESLFARVAIGGGFGLVDWVKFLGVTSWVPIEEEFLQEPQAAAGTWFARLRRRQAWVRIRKKNTRLGPGRWWRRRGSPVESRLHWAGETGGDGGIG